MSYLYMPDEFRSHFRLSRETFENLFTRIANCAAFRKRVCILEQIALTSIFISTMIKNKGMPIAAF
jgi:hypothetical protein